MVIFSLIQRIITAKILCVGNDQLGKRPLVEDVAVEEISLDLHLLESRFQGKLSSFPTSEQHEGKIIDLVHERGREAPQLKSI